MHDSDRDSNRVLTREETEEFILDPYVNENRTYSEIAKIVLDSDCSLVERRWYRIFTIAVVIGRIVIICISRIRSNSMAWLINCASRSCCDTFTIHACCKG